MNAVDKQHVMSLEGTRLKLVRDTICKDCNTQEFDLFTEVCRRVGLDPFRKQIFLNIYNKDKPDKRSMVIVTSVDGLRSIANRQGNYRPDEGEPEFEIDETLKGDTNPLGLVKAKVTVWKQDNRGAWHPLSGVAYWDEFAPIEEEVRWEGPDGQRRPVKTGVVTLDPKNPNSFWRRMPRLMLAKCAEAQALRKGWPDDLSGLYATEELDSGNVIDLTASEIVAEKLKEDRLRAVNSANTIAVQFLPADPIEFVPMGQVADRSIEFLRKCVHADEVEGFKDRNRVGLNEFWARSPSDALELKKAIEGRLSELQVVGAG